MEQDFPRILFENERECPRMYVKDLFFYYFPKKKKENDKLEIHTI